MRFTGQEQTKAVEAILESKAAGKHILPIKFEMIGRQATPVIHDIVPLEQDDESEVKIVAKRSYDINLGTKERGLTCTMKTEAMTFIDGAGVEQIVVMPCLDNNSPKELFMATHQIGQIFLALRTSVLTIAATNDDMVASSSFEPATGIILADRLVNEGRIQQSTVKDLIENSELALSGKLSQAMSEHASKKGIARATETIGHSTIQTFVDGCLTLAKKYDEITLKTGITKITASDTEPVIASRREAALQQVNRVEKKQKTYGNLL